MRPVALLLLTLAAVSAADKAPPAHTTWKAYLGGPDSDQYSALKQINKTNVKQLEVAWTYPAGERTYLLNPLVVDGVMYVLAKNSSIVALDAATGKELWVHENPPGGVGTRGVSYGKAPTAPTAV